MRESPKVLTTTLLWKRNKGTRLIAEPNGKNVKNTWTIRREVPKFFFKNMENPQRLGGDGLIL